jgi:hypothetical protein
MLGDPDLSEGLEHPQPAGGTTAPVSIGGRQGRVPASGSYLYFAIDDSLLFASLEGAPVTVQVEFHDSQPGTTLALQYDGVEDPYTSHPVVIDPPDSGRWQTVRWQIDDAFFGNRQNGGADLRIAQFGGSPIVVRRVSVILPRDPHDGAAYRADPPRWREGAVEWSVLDDATGWRLFRSPTLRSSEWSEVVGHGLEAGAFRYRPELVTASEFYRLQRPARR